MTGRELLLAGLGLVAASTALAQTPSGPDTGEGAPASEQAVSTAEPENTAAACRDTVDNDGDGFLNCADQDCWDFVFCANAAGRAAAPASSAPAPAVTPWSAAVQPGLQATRTAPDTGPDMGLVAAGVVLLGAGYVAGIIGAVADELAANCWYYSSYTGGYAVACGGWPWSAIPIAGGIVSGLVAENGYRQNIAPAMGVGVPAGAAQLTGLILMIVGLASGGGGGGSASFDVGSGASLALRSSVPGADAGVAATLSF